MAIPNINLELWKSRDLEYDNLKFKLNSSQLSWAARSGPPNFFLSKFSNVQEKIRNNLNDINTESELINYFGENLPKRTLFTKK